MQISSKKILSMDFKLLEKKRVAFTESKYYVIWILIMLTETYLMRWYIVDEEFLICKVLFIKKLIK